MRKRTAKRVCWNAGVEPEKLSRLLLRVSPDMVSRHNSPLQPLPKSATHHSSLLYVRTNISRPPASSANIVAKQGYSVSRTWSKGIKSTAINPFQIPTNLQEITLLRYQSFIIRRTSKSRSWYLHCHLPFWLYP